MAIRFRIPRVLQQYNGGTDEIYLKGPHVANMLRQLEREYPEVYRCLCDETGTLRRHIKAFVNNRMLSSDEDFESTLDEGDVVSIFQAVSGG